MTPRRIALTIVGLVAFGAAYVVYDRLMGWIDGLPLLPEQMLAERDNKFRPPPRPTSPTIEKLKEAFGLACPEAETAHYPTQLEFRSGDLSTVVAAGRFPSNPASKKVELSPFSVAVFGKPKPEYQRAPGEVVEISTFHSDKAILEFDKIINSPVDLNSAKLVKMELISDPDPDHTLPDPRMGRVHITNNQRSADPNRRFLLKTVGPVFYRDTKVRYKITREVAQNLKQASVPEPVLAKLNPLVEKNRDYPREDFEKELAKALKEETERWKELVMSHASPNGLQVQSGPDIWTDAPIEAIDHSNIPRRAGTAAKTAPTSSEELRNPEAVAAILGGHRLPPPTITAVGMRVYMYSEEAKKQQPNKGSNGGGLSGIRLIELLEQVVVNLWVEGGQGLVGSEGKSSTIPEAPPAAAALGGGLVSAHYAMRELGRDLLQIETRGKFAYNTEKHLARFDVLPPTDPNFIDDVRSTKVPPRPGIQTLFSQVLELEFNDSPLGAPDSQAQTPPKPATPAANKSTSSTGSSPQFKRLHAWSYTPGHLITVSSDTDKMTAYGQDLVRVQATEMTQFTGSPLYAMQQRSTLLAGGPNVPGILIMEPVPGSTSGERQSTVLGSGRIEIFDPSADKTTMAAEWKTSMVQTKEYVNKRQLDLYTLTDGAMLEDLQSQYWLKGKTIKLWMSPSSTADGETPKPSRSTVPASPAARSQLDRILAIGDVTAHSGDLDIEHTDQFNALFTDISPPAATKPPAANSAPAPSEPGVPAGPPGAPMPQPQQPVEPEAPNQPKEPEKPKPPMKIRARKIDAWVNRYPEPKTEAKTPAAPAAAPRAQGGTSTSTGGMKHQLERAWCEGMVIAHQDPDDPSKPQGTDILGSQLTIDSTPDGSKLTVQGWDFRPGEVHNEGTSLIGPKVIIDQLHNLAVIEGRGSLVLPANSDLTGAEVKKSDKKSEQKGEPVVVHFRDGMKFEGTKKVAEFFGKVNASQGESWIICHTMQVIVDRPVYFTQTNRPSSSSRPAGGQGSKANGPANGPGTPSGTSPADDDRAKIDVIYCYPAPADVAESPQEKIVIFRQIERDPETGKPTRRQELRVRELTLRAQVKDESRGEPYRMVLGDGPGVARIWAPETKDEDANGSAKKQEPKEQPPETEMKLTEIRFSQRMIAKDKGDFYKESTFYESVQVINLPTENPDLVIELHRLPPEALLLNCNKKLLVWSHKNPRLPDQPATQYMHAFGNAFLQNKAYEGWGEVVRSEGQVVWFDGSGLVPARIKSRFNRNDNSGQQIRFDRSQNRYTVIRGIGGEFIEGSGQYDDNRPNTPPMPMNNQNSKDPKNNNNNPQNKNNNP